ncbi:MAG: helix-turn-helix transcriptional regulator [Solirubrobacteraceae bacterium]
MPSSTSRLLELLEMLQARPGLTGREIAERLAVDRRTVRRYVASLQELGIPIDGERGVGGGYRLRPGYRVPPLMLSEDEAVGVTIGVLAAQRLGLGDPDGIDRAIAKIRRVLPESLRRRVEALEAALTFTASPGGATPPDADTALLLAEAIRRHRRVRLDYSSSGGTRTQRELSPYGLVVHAGRWYLAAHDHGRGALRTFRVDRVAGARLTRASAAAPPPDFDALEHVTRSLAQVPWPWAIDVRLDLPIEEARARIPRTLAELAPDDEATRLRMRVSSLDWAASLLAGLGCAFEVRAPDELRTAVHELAARLLRT